MKQKTSGFGPSLIELVVAVALFAVAAAICVKIFAGAKSLSDDGARLSRAVMAAQTCAESFKASGGDTSAAARLCGASETAQGFEIFYDSDFNICTEGAKYQLISVISEEKGVILCKIGVYEGDEEIYAITAATAKEARDD